MARRDEAAFANRPGDRGGALDGQRAVPDQRLHIQAICVALPPVLVPPKENIRMPAQLYIEGYGYRASLESRPYIQTKRKEGTMQQPAHSLLTWSSRHTRVMVCAARGDGARPEYGTNDHVVAAGS
jgi:hypothetical protein